MAPFAGLITLLGSNCSKAVGSCLLLACTYVGSLYIWRTKFHRDHPTTIKKRFVSVLIMGVVSPLFVVFCSEKTYFGERGSLPTLLGFRWKGLLQAFVLPLGLTMVLFSGPLLLHYLDGVCGLYLKSRYWMSNLRNLIWLRNHIVAPFSEEFTFRACMLPILVPCFGASLSIVICPLFFGVAHLHHLRERMERSTNTTHAVFQSLFQFLYTSLFGVYSAYLFLRTGHFMAPFIAHAFCNHMGFPDFIEVLSYKQPVRTFLVILFLLGFFGWLVLLEPLTKPAIFSNLVYV
ncbi:CAAX prenyl protease 2-like isoform X1 [Limulus polyphemus]|uniref:CAAX prenyl protease 2 n=1 Tax=Limulus polyphemus TaxID=6850 RepID=A0ABM1BRN1_LIMPO|nr:CAAX prenyl protease 2-like isoform X1 [Limulus polyphemus]